CIRLAVLDSPLGTESSTTMALKRLLSREPMVANAAFTGGALSEPAGTLLTIFAMTYHPCAQLYRRPVQRIVMATAANVSDCRSPLVPQTLPPPAASSKAAGRPAKPIPPVACHRRCGASAPTHPA